MARSYKVLVRSKNEEINEYETDDVKINFENIYFDKDIDLTNVEKYEQKVKELADNVYEYRSFWREEKEIRPQINEKFKEYKDDLGGLHSVIKKEIDLYLNIWARLFARDKTKNKYGARLIRSYYYNKEKKYFDEQLSKATTYEESVKLFNNLIDTYFKLDAEEIQAFGDKKVCIGFNGKNLNDKNIESLFKAIDYFKLKGYKVIPAVCSENSLVNEKIPYYYSSEELKKLEELNNKLIEKYGEDLELRYSEDEQLDYKEVNYRRYDSGYYNKWTHSQVKSANDKIDNLVNVIKENNFTPFETMIFLHGYISKMPYKHSKNIRESRVLPGIIAGKNNSIVCVGYATLMKSVIDRLNDPNLSCNINVCDVRNTSSLKTITKYSGHANNVVNIKDEKYGIEGVYMEDACWDAPKANKTTEPKGYSYCLYPIEDIYSLNKKIYIQEGIITNRELMNYQLASTKITDKFINNFKLGVSRLKRAGVYSEHKNNSSAISMEKYANALNNVVSCIKPEMSQEQVQEYVKNEMKKTRDNAHEKFNITAKSSFAKYNIKD